MSGYAEALMTSFALFPAIAFVFTIPYIIYCYRKFGSILSIRVLIVYSFILYLMCVYFLVILPLPDRASVAARGHYTAQLIPFNFVFDIIKDMKEYSFFRNKALWQCIFNVFMTIPFGVYLRYYFKCSFKKTLIYAFCLSLFFELTQLTGLYFIYKFNYRLFDVDDLLFNTSGALIGYWAIKPFFKILPSRDKIDENDTRKGEYVSFARRACAYVVDFAIALALGYIIDFILILCLQRSVVLNKTLIRFLYFIIISLVRDGETLGMTVFKIDMDARDSGKLTPVMILTHYVILFASFDLVPYVLGEITNMLEWTDVVQGIFATAFDIIMLFWKVIMAVYVYLSMRDDHTTFYDELSHTMIISYIGGKHPLPPEDEQPSTTAPQTEQEEEAVEEAIPEVEGPVFVNVVPEAEEPVEEKPAFIDLPKEAEEETMANEELQAETEVEAGTEGKQETEANEKLQTELEEAEAVEKAEEKEEVSQEIEEKKE